MPSDVHCSWRRKQLHYGVCVREQRGSRDATLSLETDIESRTAQPMPITYSILAVYLVKLTSQLTAFD